MSCNFVANIDTIRVTEVDACGKPVVGAENAFVTNCVATLAMNVVTDDQDDKIFRAANGTLCAIKRGCRTLLGYDTELTVLQASPEMIGIMTGTRRTWTRLAKPSVSMTAPSSATLGTPSNSGRSWPGRSAPPRAQ